jgi:predicted amidohydrolase
MNKNHDQLVVAVSQMTSVDDLQKNLESIAADIEKAGQSQGVDLICFPENCLYLRVKEGEAIQFLNLQESFWLSLQNLAKTYRLAIHFGSVPLLINSIPYNSAVFIQPDGKILANYQKMHLFDIQLENQKPIRESDVFRAGAQPGLIDLKGWKIGQTICYDIRFSDLYRHYAELEVDLILVPAAFLVKTGDAHWHTLLRARAIESQAYLVASAQTGRHQSVHNSADFRMTYGHALVIDPWGELLLDMKAPVGLEIVVLQKSKIELVRRQIPMKNHRRRDFFKS